MKRLPVIQELSFRSQLVRLAEGINYFGLSVPAKITAALGTLGPVPVSATINDSNAFLVSLYPVGEGRHFIRVKAEIRNAAKIKEGDRVSVRIEVLDRAAKISVPKGLVNALRAAQATKNFNALPPGKKAYLIRLIDDATKPETQNKRIQEAVRAAQVKKI